MRITVSWFISVDSQPVKNLLKVYKAYVKIDSNPDYFKMVRASSLSAFFSFVLKVIMT